MKFQCMKSSLNCRHFDYLHKQVLRQMLADRDESYKSLMSLCGEMQSTSGGPSSSQLAEMEMLWDAVNKTFAEDEKKLELILSLAKVYEEKLQPILIWLDAKEKVLNRMELKNVDLGSISQLLEELIVRDICSIQCKCIALICII